MADIIRKVRYYKTKVADEPGEGARVLGVLKDAGVNLLAFTGFPRGRRAQLDFIPEDEALFKKVAKKANIKLAPQKAGFLVQGEDRVGTVYKLVSKLAKAKINITAIDAVTAGKGRYGAILWVKPRDVGKASKILKAR